MKKREKFNTVEEYENYLNKLSHFWTMLYKLFPEIKDFEHPGTFDWAMTTIVNDLDCFEQHIKMLELLLEHNTRENRDKYVAIINKITYIGEDFM